MPPSTPPSLPLQDAPVLDSHMTWRESGSGPSVVFLHGNPTSSFVWRSVMPRVPGVRALAPDLIGMGGSGKPELGYRFADHARYLEAWMDGRELGDVVLVGYDWGGALALDWARRHSARVRGVVVFETFLRPMEWRMWPPRGEELFRALRTPGVGEGLVLERNEFLAASLANGVLRGLSDEERAVYAAPFPDPASRRPVLQWPREIPIVDASTGAAEPADVAEVMRAYGAWMAATPRVPKLLLTFASPSPLGSEELVDWAKANVAGLERKALGPAGHHAPEDRPEEIGDAIATWLASVGR